MPNVRPLLFTLLPLFAGCQLFQVYVPPTPATPAVRLQGEINLFYRARVVTPGKFVVPPVYAEDMYRPDTYGLAEGDGSLTVIDGK